MFCSFLPIWEFHLFFIGIFFFEFTLLLTYGLQKIKINMYNTYILCSKFSIRFSRIITYIYIYMCV